MKLMSPRDRVCVETLAASCVSLTSPSRRKRAVAAILGAWIAGASSGSVQAQGVQTGKLTPLPRLQVGSNGRCLTQGSPSGKPFFWLADTGWALFNRFTLDEAERYLEKRAQQGFNVVQVFMTADWMAKNAAGEAPFVGDDPLRLNEKYFAHVDAVLEKAQARGIYLVLLIGQVLRNEVPAWQLRTEDAAYRYGLTLAQRLGRHTNLLLNVGQDFAARDYKFTGFDVKLTALAMAEGVADGMTTVVKGRKVKVARDGKADYTIMPQSFHPDGKHSSVEYFPDDAFMAFHMLQTGHDYSYPNFAMVDKAYGRKPIRPVIDSEPAYENHPAGFDARNGRVGAFHIRRHAYWAVLAGACGHTYGHYDVFGVRRARSGQSMAYGEMTWEQALDAPGAQHMGIMRRLFEGRRFDRMAPNRELVVGHEGPFTPLSGPLTILAAKGEDYAVVYSPSGSPFSIRPGKFSTGDIYAWWIDPRTGERTSLGKLAKQDQVELDPPGLDYEGRDIILWLQTAP
jgi:hypothetical protein